MIIIFSLKYTLNNQFHCKIHLLWEHKYFVLGAQTLFCKNSRERIGNSSKPKEEIWYILFSIIESIYFHL